LASTTASERLAVFGLSIGFALGSAVHARDGNTLKDELRIFSDEVAVQCSAVQQQLKDFKVRADPLTAFTLKDAVQSLCVCMPAQTQAFTGTLSAADLARPVTEEEFLELFNPAVIDKCAAEQMQSMYGEHCRERFRQADLDVDKYCACMKTVVSGYSEAKAAAIATAASEFLPLAAAAEQNGQPVPSRPPILEDYYQADQVCKKK
jgi:hypothetical protein